MFEPLSTPIRISSAGVTRLAPSPTGALHLGNARTFLVNWALARRLGWRIVLRIEDLDGPRIKPEAAQGIIDTLRWLGIDWDEGPTVQSADLRPYRAAMAVLAGRGFTYPCDLTRQQIEAAASAPQEGAHDVPFPPELRPTGFRVGSPSPESAIWTSDQPATGNWRFATPTGPAAQVHFTDAFAGPQRIDTAATIGDFVIWTKRAAPAYQLAVVVDDARQGVTDVVRGADLLDSAARQLLLYRALGLPNEPRYWHLPLVVGPDGKRLAKRHGDTRVDAYRAAGVPAEAVIGLIAAWGRAGETGARNHRREPMSAEAFAQSLDLTIMPKGPVTFTPEDDQWLRSLAR